GGGAYVGGVFDLTQNLVITVLWVVFGVVKIWAFVDCVRRPAQAFPAVGRVSKLLWLLLTGIAMLTGFIPGLTLGIIGIAGIVVALVYLFDVRVRIAELMG
ncbi:MAG: DUF2516 family protein, partial [Candidatus Nanopelagicales bacterium]